MDKPASQSKSPPLSYLSLFPEKMTALVGDGILLKITARDTAGVNVPHLVPEYSSSNPDLVRFDEDTIIIALGAGTVTIRASAGGLTAETIIYINDSTYDLSDGIPEVLNANYIDLSKIGRVSRFRSTVGHSYTDGSESCRSMKHYFEPKSTVDWKSVDIFAPVSGTILEVRPDGEAGYQVLLRPYDLAAFYVAMFHVSVDSGIVKNCWVNAGDHIGRHASSFTTSDIAMFFGAKDGGTLVSYFQVMTDEVFAQFQARGVPSREAAIITREERDADPVPCEGEQPFTIHGNLPDWLVLN